MRTLAKFVLLVALLILLSILVQPQPSRCAEVVEYLLGEGVMAFTSGEFAPATINATITSSSSSDYLPLLLFGGEITIEAISNVTGKTIYNSKFKYTGYQNFSDNSFILTTKGGPILSGPVIDDGENPPCAILSLQDNSDGITGFFVINAFQSPSGQ